LIAIGSTGDVLPMVALGGALRARGHRVTLYAFEQLAPLAAKAGLPFTPLPGDARAFIGGIMRPGASPFTLLSRMRAALGEAAEPLMDGLQAACAANEAVVTTFFGSLVGRMAEALGIPAVQVHYMPLEETSTFAIPASPWVHLGAPLNRATYRLAFGLIDLLERRVAFPMLRARGVDPRPVRPGSAYPIGGAPPPVLCAFSPAIVPRDPRWGAHIRLTGEWHGEMPPFTPSPALQAFLAAGDAPVYVGFGSMAEERMARIAPMVARVARSLGVRVVLAMGWSRAPDASDMPGVYLLREYVPHAWLFQRVCAAVHHAGAGTTAEALRCGLPALAVPFGTDQYFWGDRIHRLGAGPKPLPRARLTRRAFERRMAALLHTPAYRENALRVAAAMRQEEGVALAADYVEHAVRGDDGGFGDADRAEALSG
jgi:UDP:flavonoid glycosyltransferase YjiC (YdhE family)